MESYIFDSVEDALEAIRQGELVVVMDDESRENEGDLIMAAELTTAGQVALMVRNTTGILCVSMTKDRADRLMLPPMVINNSDPKQTAFTVSCDAIGAGTGVSATDRTSTIRALADDSHTAEEFHRPGHIFPLVARPGGVLERRGHTEASVDLCKLAGLKPVGLLAELVNDDGSMSRLKECYAFAKAHNLRITTVEALVEYRNNLAKKDVKVELLAECEVPIKRNGEFLGPWRMRCYRSVRDGLSQHIVLIKGDVRGGEPVLTRIHSECFTGHVIGSMRCDCNEQMDVALKLVNTLGRGLVMYVDGHEGRGIGLHNKMHAYKIQQEQNMDTYEANERLGFASDLRNYDTPIAILKELGISKIDMITNNPLKVKAFADMVASVVPALCEPNEHNLSYLQAKRKFEKEALKEINSPVTVSTRSSSLFSPTSMVPSAAEALPQTEASVKLPDRTETSKFRIGVLTTSWNRSLISSISGHCLKALVEYGISENNLVLEEPVPGSFELPFAAQRLARKGTVDAIICFGVLIKGETSQYKYISNSVSQGLMQVQLSTDVPIINGVLNCMSLEQAHTRCSSDSTLALALAATAIHMAAMKNGTLHSSPSMPLLQPCAMG